MTAAEVADSEKSISAAGLRSQAIAFLQEFAGFAGMAGLRGAALSVLGAVFESVGLVLLVPLLSIVTGGGGAPNWLHGMAVRLLQLTGAQSRTAQLSVLLGVFAALIVMRAVVAARRDRTLSQLQMGFVEQFRSRLAQKLAAAPWPVVSRLQHARVTQLMSGDIQRIGAAALQTVQMFTTSVLTLFQIAVVLLLGPALACIALILIGVGVAANLAMLGRAHGLGARLGRVNVALMHETTQFLGALKLAAGQNRQADFVREFEQSLAAVKREQIAFIRQQSSNRRTATVITGLVAALIAFVGLTVLDTPAPVLIAMLLVFARIAAPAMQMTQMLQQFAHALPAYAEVRRLERELAPAPASDDRTAADLTPGPVVFRHVRFRYDETRPYAGPFADLDLAIAPGSFIGVTGPSGAGKTTFADLLIGLLEPQAGDITIAGVPMRGATAARWRDHVSYVVQDPYLFRDTVRRNLLWASPQSSEADIWQALTLAEAAEVVAAMPDGLDTVLGERGTLISGGERQRLCLARAALRRPWLYVLDEATSAIDAATERKILKALTSLSPRPTIVMIAHRHESLAGCDRILRFSPNEPAVLELAPAG